MRSIALALSAALFVACSTPPAEPAADAKADAEATADAKTADAKPADAAHGEGHGDHGAKGGMPALPAVPEGAKVMFVEPADGAEVNSPVKVVFGVEGMTVKPAGEVVEGTGHHHVIIDAPTPAAGEVVPADETHIHYGGGQTEAELELAPGEHKLSMQFADGMHRSYGPQLTATITVTVTE